MQEETLYTISQLAELAGVTPRTIRYYTTEGLLPRPDSRGQYAVYGEEHMLRLRLIGWLKQAYLPLGEIKARIENLDDRQIRQLLHEIGETPAPSAPASATDYLAHVRARQQPPALQRIAEQPEPYGVAGTPVLGLRSSDVPESPVGPAPAAPVYGFAAALPAAETRPEQHPQSPGLLRKLIPPRRNAEASNSLRAAAAPAQEPAAIEQHWRHVVLAPGVELHVREPVAAPVRERIDRLLALARTMFEVED